MNIRWTDMHDAWRRVRYADKHLERLGSLASDWAQVNGSKIEGHFNCQLSRYEFRVTGEMPPAYFGLVLGDVLHGYRATLDNIFQLALTRDGATPNEKAGFRICLSDADKQANDYRRDSKGLRPVDRAVLDSFQPREWNEYARQHPLHLLDKFSIFDKHRVLLPTIASHRMVVTSETGLQRPVTSSRYLRPGTSINVPHPYVSSGAVVTDHGTRPDPADPRLVYYATLQDAGPSPHIELEPALDLQVAWHREGMWLSLDHLREISHMIKDLITATEDTL